MKKALIAVAVAFVLAASAVMPTTAEAQGRRFWTGVGLGVAGAALFGAAAAAAVDPRWRGYAPVEGYYYYPGYAAAPGAPCPGGFWGARVVGRNQFGQPIYGNPRWICPPPGYAYTNYYYR